MTIPNRFSHLKAIPNKNQQVSILTGQYNKALAPLLRMHKVANLLSGARINRNCFTALDAVADACNKHNAVLTPAGLILCQDIAANAYQDAVDKLRGRGLLARAGAL